MWHCGTFLLVSPLLSGGDDFKVTKKEGTFSQTTEETMRELQIMPDETLGLGFWFERELVLVS